jgi:hypothetical protein
MSDKYPIKLHIKKLGPMKHTWVKYYLTEKLLLEPDGPIQNEAQLCWYIYNKYGSGRYQILAWQKGKEGFWMFWLGDLYEQGFIRDLNKNKELSKLQSQLYKAKTYEEREEIQENIDFEREIGNEERKTKRRGVYGIEKSKAGILHPYQEF